VNKRRYIFSNSTPLNISYSANKESGTKKIEFEMCVFSTSFNRNKAYFQVSKLLEYRDKLNRILTNINHDLSLSGGKYMGNLTKYSNLQGRFSESNLEIWVKVESKDPLLIQYKDDITAPSIELIVEEKDIISGENGEYFVDFDWVAIAFLVGVPAGNGDARIESIRQFDNNINKKTMTEEQVKQLLEKQAEDLKKEFSQQTEAIKVEFAKIAEDKQSNKGEYTYVNEKGEVVKTTWESIYNSLTEIVEKEEVMEDSPLILMMKAKKFKISKEVEEEPKKEETEEEIKEADEAITKAEAFQAKMQAIRTDEVVENKDNKPAETKDFNLDLELKKIISNNLK